MIATTPKTMHDYTSTRKAVRTCFSPRTMSTRRTATVHFIASFIQPNGPDPLIVPETSAKVSRHSTSAVNALGLPRREGREVELVDPDAAQVHADDRGAHQQDVGRALEDPCPKDEEQHGGRS